MKTAKLIRVGTWTLGILLGTLVLLSVALSYLDWNQYRGALSELATERLGMRVELAGTVKIGIIPRPAVVVESVRLSPLVNDPSEVVATAERIEMQLGLSALLSGKLSVAQLNLDGLDVQIDQDADGSWGVKGWPKAAAAGETAEPAAPVSALQLDRLQVQGGRITIQPYGSNATRIEGLSFVLSGLVPTGPLEWQGSFVTGGETVTTSGRLRPTSSGADDALKLEIGAGGATLSASGRIGADDGSGRLQFSGGSLGAFMTAVAKLTGGEAGPTLPAMPFSLDVQLDRAGGIIKAQSRHLNVGDTRGRLDLTIAEGQQPHTTGTLALGIIDLDPWIEALSKAPAAQAEVKSTPILAPAMPMTGTLDIAIEALRVAGDAVQHLDAIVGIGADGPYVRSIAGLLPGGSTLAFDGKISAAQGGDGKLSVKSGNLQQLLRWAQIDLSDSVQPGRLATLDLGASVHVATDSWIVSDIKGQVDTMAIDGALAGRMAGGMPGVVTLHVDQINLDAYLGNSKADGGETPDLAGFLPADEMKFDLQADKLQWQGNRFTGISLKGSADARRVTLNQMAIDQGGGQARMSGSARLDGANWILDSNLTLDKWGLPIVRALTPESRQYLDALGAKVTTAQMSLAGPVQNLRLSLRADQGAGNWAMNGTLGIGHGSLAQINLQGTMNHKDLAPLMRVMGLADARALPAALTYTLAGSTADKPFALKVSGELGGGQMIADGTVGTDASQVRMTYDHLVAAQAFNRLGLGIKAPDPKAAVRADMMFALAGESWKLSDMTVRNGAMTLQGNLVGTFAGRVDGALSLSGFKLRTAGVGAKKGAVAAEEEFTLPTGWEQYAGQITLLVQDLQAQGQRLDAPKAVLTLGDGSLRFDLGSGAQLNGKAALAKFNMVSGKIPRISGQIDVAGLDIGAFLKAQKLGVAASGDAGFKLDFEATGATGAALIKSMKGRGELNGGVGVMNFMAVPKLVQEMSVASSGTGFLKNIGGMLRGGHTNFSQMQASFSIDSGIALIESLKAFGDWGNFGLDGQVNLADQRMALKGTLNLSKPQDAPVIPVSYTGSLSDPQSNWTSRALESFVISGIERKLRSSLFQESQTQAGATDEPALSPGTGALGTAFNLLANLKKKQDLAKKKAEEEARAKAAEKDKPSP